MGKNQCDLKMESDLARTGRLVVLEALFWRSKGFRKRLTHTTWDSNHSSTFNLCLVPYFRFPKDKSSIFARLGLRSVEMLDLQIHDFFHGSSKLGRAGITHLY